MSRIIEMQRPSAQGMGYDLDHVDVGVRIAKSTDGKLEWGEVLGYLPADPSGENNTEP